MSEPELTPTPAPAPAKSSLLRRLLTPSNIGFYLMIVLAWIGAIYTAFSVESSRWYWQWLIPAFGVICIATQWNNVEPTLKARLLMAVRQVLHWGVVMLMTWLIFMASGQVSSIDALDDRQASLVLMFTVTLSTFLAGIYFDWRLCVVAVFILAGGVVNVAFSNLAPLLAWIGLGVAVLYFIGAWLYNRWQERKPPLAES